MLMQAITLIIDNVLIAMAGEDPTEGEGNKILTVIMMMARIVIDDAIPLSVRCYHAE